MQTYTLNCGGRLIDLRKPLVMGILNVTPDSFYASSRNTTETKIAESALKIVNEHGDIIDIGACSTRPHSTPVSESEEAERLRMALTIVQRETPDATISVDTFRPSIARMAVEEFGVHIINDVSGGEKTDGEDVTPMFREVARLGVPYVLISHESTIRDTLMFFARSVAILRDLGQKDVLLDPGFGFGKSMEQNYDLLRDMEKLRCLDLPLLVGLSRKSMIWKSLRVTPEKALNGTTVLNVIALIKGASVLRVHDVREAVEAVKLVSDHHLL